MFNIRCAFRVIHLELLTRCALVEAKYLKYGFVMVLLGPNYTRESDAQNAGNGVSEVQLCEVF